MSSLKSVFLGLATVVISGAAWSAPTDPGVTAVVKKVPDEVTLKRGGLAPLAAYKVTLTNGAASSLNRVSFNGTANLLSAAIPPATEDVPSAIAIEPIIKVSAQDPNCTITTTNVLSCAVETLAPRSSLVFYVVVKSPSEGKNINFNWSFSGAEGGGVGNSIFTVTGLASTKLTDALLSTTVKFKASSFVASATGLTLFTGGGSSASYPYAGSPATGTDPYTTTVVIPPGVNTEASILETEAASVVCQPGECFISQLTILDATYSVTNPLIIFLRRDATTTSGNINNSVVSYTSDAGVTIQLAACDLTTPAGPLDKDTPCIFKRTVIQKATAPSDVWAKDWQFEIWALGNGKYAN